MTNGKTRDGISIDKVIRMVQNIGVSIRNGTNHHYILNYENLRPCPVAQSTNAKTMLVPWLKQILEYGNKDIYQALKNGRW